MKSFFVVILFFLNLLAEEKTCISQWIEKSGKRYIPPKSLDIVYVEFIGKNVDKLKFRTQNNSSFYKYNDFVNVNKNLGISFKAENGNIIDLFSNGDLYIWNIDKTYLKAKCINIGLDIK